MNNGRDFKGDTLRERLHGGDSMTDTLREILGGGDFKGETSWEEHVTKAVARDG